MKRAVAALVLALAVGMPPALAQTYPAVMTVVKDVEVRSGPTMAYHPTIKLRAGDRVLVRHPSKDQPTWLAIAPPQGSFSWIDAKHVKQLDGKSGFVLGEANQEIEIKPGSSMVSAAPNTVSSVKVKPGYQFAILGAPLTNDGTTWLPITPHPEEDRYIPGDALQGGLGGSVPVPVSNGAGANTLITQADQAYLGGNLERAKQLYKEAADRSTDFQEKSYCYNRLASLAQGSWGTNPSGQPAKTSGPPTQLVSTTNPNTKAAPPPAGFQYAAAWSKWGVLRNTVFEKDGQPMYVLENDRGQPLLYATTTAGFSLRGYVGKMVALYGPMNYHNQIRAYYMTTSHVAENK